VRACTCVCVCLCVERGEGGGAFGCAYLCFINALFFWYASLVCYCPVAADIHIFTDTLTTVQKYTDTYTYTCAHRCHSRGLG